MTISEETLMAFADGELDDQARAEVELAMRTDPEIEKRIARHRALSRRVQAAYAAELSEEIPQRLLAAANVGPPTQGAKVANLQDAREAALRRAEPAQRDRPRWRPLVSIAASVIVGLGLGYLMWGQAQPSLMRTAGGTLVAHGKLAAALSSQLAAHQPANSSVQIGLSFLAKSGDYCRTFSLAGAISPSGLACRHDDEWQIQTLAQTTGAAAGTTEYRTAGSAMSPVILRSIEEEIAGDPLTEAGESAARRNGWKAAAQ